MAKRQQFSCDLGTATLSLKLENVIPGCWICFFSYCGQVFFVHQCAVLVRSSIFQKISYDVTFFSTSTAVNQSFFVHISSFFEARLKPIAALATSIETSTALEHLPFVCIHEHTVNLRNSLAGDYIKVYHRDFCRESCLILAARMLELTERWCKDTIAWQQCIGFLQF